MRKKEDLDMKSRKLIDAEVGIGFVVSERSWWCRRGLL